MTQQENHKYIKGFVSAHTLATIALKTNFGKETEFFFYRRDMTQDSLKPGQENCIK